MTTRLEAERERLAEVADAKQALWPVATIRAYMAVVSALETQNVYCADCVLCGEHPAEHKEHCPLAWWEQEEAAE